MFKLTTLTILGIETSGGVLFEHVKVYVVVTKGEGETVTPMELLIASPVGQVPDSVALVQVPVQEVASGESHLRVADFPLNIVAVIALFTVNVVVLPGSSVIHIPPLG